MGGACRCPVCQARFRGGQTCSRCGADLTAIMTLAARSWGQREAARWAIASGEFERAAECAAEAQRLQGTAAGESLVLLVDWLNAGPGARDTSPAVAKTEEFQIRKSATLEVHLL